MSHQKQELVQTDQAYGEDYEWGEMVRDEKMQASIVERLRNSLETQVKGTSYAASEPRRDEENSTTLNSDVYDPTKSFSNKMRPRKMRRESNPSVDDNVNSREQQPPLEASRDSSENKIEASSYSPSDDFAEKMSPRKMNRSALPNAQETSPLISSTRA